MMSMTIPATEARKNFLHLVDQVDDEYTRVDITKSGRIRATLVSSDYLEALEESLYTREHSMAAIRRSEEEIAAGQYVTLEKYLAKINARKAVDSSPKRSKASR